jgi:hypothetical protein
MTQAVPMPIVTAASAIQEVDHNFVSNFGANHRAKNSEPFGLSLASAYRYHL